jgi:hypothetical protein
MKRTTLACLLALLPAIGWSNVIPTGAGITGSGPYLWTYDFQLSGDQDVHSGLPPTASPVAHTNVSFGSFVTIYDFAGYVAGSCFAPAGWVCSSQNVGFTPDDVLPNDDASLPNLTWVYTTGPTLSGQPDGLDLGLFGAASVYNNVTLVSYAARAVKNVGASAGTIADNVGLTQGPSATLLPEPASLALSGLALALMAGVLPRRQARR